MEDPWANAWKDSSNPLWVSPSVSVPHGDNEDDLSTPSWPKDSVSAWGATDLSADHIWHTTEISSTWNPRPSTFDEISLAGDYMPQPSSQTEIQEAEGHSSSLSLQEEEAWALPETQLQEVKLPAFPPSFPGTVAIETLKATNVSNLAPGREDEESSSPSQSPPTSPLQKSTLALLPEDVDGFGSFETGHVNQDKESWTPSNSMFPPTPSTDSANWDSAWKAEDGDNEQEDAWETARRQRENQDRHVPPELLASILRQLEGLSKEIWEDPGTSDPEINENVEIEMLGLNPVLQRLSPDDMTLPPTVPFTKTFTMKHMSESLKLTRHYTSTRSSPMAMYLASKGSNSWEASVKAQPIIASDDVTPVGWKIVDPSTQQESPVDEGKKKPGGIFSFFGRRSHNLSLDGSSKRSASPMTPSGVTSSKASTPRTGSPVTAEQSNTAETSKVVVPEPSDNIPEVNKLPSTLATTDAAKDEVQTEATQPSAVSRFLGRIVGRSKTRSIDSLALSADDLEFLADVPTSSNSKTLQDDDLRTMLETPLPSRPLAPPSHLELPLPKLPPPPSRSIRPERPEDLLALFDSAPTPTAPDNPLTMNPSSGAMPSSVTATPQSSIKSTSAPKQLWRAFEEPTINSTPSKHPDIDSIDLLKSSPPSIALPRPQTINGSTIKSAPKSSISTSIHVLEPPIFSSTSLPSKSVQVDDDDDFSDFLSSPAVENPKFNPFSLDNLDGPSITIPSIKTTDIHDDFGDFGEVINDFSAPKSSPFSTRVPAAAPTSSTQPKSVETRKASKKADHSRTLSLLEAAATRGRWLSPPSPIPEPLSPPPASGSSTVGPDSRKLDMQAQQALAMAASPSSNSTFAMEEVDTGANAWRLPPPPPGTLLAPSVISLAPAHTRLTPPFRPELVQSSRSSSNVRLGGLSAQDLSFFEGL